MSRRPRISFCMIAKNEAQFIVECLESVRETVDEMIVVDTGSTDGTPELARQAGASVFSFTWCDDFAAARNASLAHARGKWVLWLDADERLAPGSGRVIREAVARDTFDCGFLPMYDAASLDASPEDVVSGRARHCDPYQLPKLLRRTPDLGFEGVVHENVNTWITSGRRIATLPAPIIHLGYVPELRQARDKDGRNLKLLLKRAEQEPDNPSVFGFLAQEYQILGRMEDAREAAEKGWALADANPDTAFPSLRLAVIRAQMQLHAGDAQAALDTMVRAEDFIGPHPDIDLFGGLALIELAVSAADSRARQSYVEAATSAFESALAKSEMVFPERCVSAPVGVAATISLGVIGLMRNEPEGSLERFEEALARQPHQLDALIGRAEALSALGRQVEALRILEPLLGQGPDSWLVAAGAAERLGRWDDFQFLLRQAQGRAEGQRYFFPHRRWEQSAMASRLSAYQGTPVPGPGAPGAACALLLGAKPERPPEPIDARERGELEMLVENLVRLGHVNLIERLCDDEAEVLLPGLRSVLTTAVPRAAAGVI